MQLHESTISISEDLINRQLKNHISSIIGKYLSNYSVSFSGGTIYVSLSINAKALGMISAKYRLKILDFKFDRDCHRVKLTYREDVSSKEGPIQALMLKAAGMTGGNWLQRLITVAKLSGITADENSCSINFEQLLSFDNEWIRQIILYYIDSRDGMLKLGFCIAPNNDHFSFDEHICDNPTTL